MAKKPTPDAQADKPAPKSLAQRQAEFRARHAMLGGAAEVRGIFLPLDLHAQVKEYARKLAAQAAKAAA